MKTIFSTILIIAAFGSCGKSPMNANTGNITNSAINVKPGAIIDSLSYLALGDSYTIGEAIDPTQAFPYQLINQLNVRQPSGPVIIARTGWTTGDLINAINQTHLDKKFDLVTLLIGVNNQYRDYNEPAYRKDFIQLLNTAIKFANGNKNHVFVLSIPDYGVTPFAGGDDSIIGPQIDKLNAINKAESETAGVNYLNITGISKNAATDASLIARDGLHPSAQMYELWMQQLVPMVRAQLVK